MGEFDKQTDLLIHELENGTPLEEFNREELLEYLKNCKKEIASTRGKEELYRMVIDHAYNLGYFLSEDRKKLLYISPSCKRLTGYDQEAFYADPELLKKIIHPDDMSRYMDVSTVDFAVTDFRIIKKDGISNWISYHHHKVFDKDGTLKGFRVSNRDIHDRKLAEEKLRDTEQKLREIIEHSTNMFYRHDTENKLTYSSPQSVALLGYQPEEINMSWADLLTDHPVNRIALASTRRAIETGVPQPTYEVEMRKKNGELIWAEVREAPVVVDGETDSIVGSLTDVTDRKRAEETINKSLKEKEVLLSEIHHRVKNNLAVISGLLMLEAADQSDPRVKSTLLKNESRIRSMALIHDKLYQEETFAEIEFGSYLQELIGHFQQQVVSASVNITFNFNVDEIYLDITKAIPCGLMLNELATNGYKHAFQGRTNGTIHFTLHRRNGRVVLRYKDDGVGLPDHIIEQVKSMSSIGLGINLINGLTQQLQGDLTIKNEDGAFVEVSFPDTV